MKKILLVVIVALCDVLSAQTFYRKSNGKFDSEKISVIEKLDTLITIKVSYKSSAKCACDESEEIKVRKNKDSSFKYLINEDSESEEKSVVINLINNQVSSIVVANSEDYNCCSINTGTYVLKPIVEVKKTVNTPSIKTKQLSQQKSKEITIEIPITVGSLEGIMIAVNCSSTALSWSEASVKCENLVFGSNSGNTDKFDDWRLPSKEELCIIYDYYKKDAKYFKAGSEYWTSQNSAKRAGFYFSVKFFTMDLPCQPSQNDGSSKFELIPVRSYSKVQVK